jgi:hypothetical protein
MMITRLTVHPLLYFCLCSRFIHGIILRPFRLQDYGFRCVFGAGTASGASHRFAIDDRSVGFVRITDQDAIVEIHKQGIGMPAKKRVQSTMSV